jgi:hypothetical protein
MPSLETDHLAEGTMLTVKAVCTLTGLVNSSNNNDRVHEGKQFCFSKF